MKIALIPIDIVCGDKEANFGSLNEACRILENDTDIIVLPELFSTGFSSSREKLEQWAETNGGDTVAAIHAIAGKYNVAVTGSFLARTASHIYNRAFFIEPSGDESFCDKRHLFSMSSESSLLTPGREPVLNVRFRGWNISVVICYDLRFPAWCRNSDRQYDLLIVPANWPSSREYAWSHLLQARAIENQAYIVGANRCGSDKFGDYDGMNRVYDFTGHPVELCGTRLQYAKLNHETLERWRNDFPVWKDNDHFDIIY